MKSFLKAIFLLFIIFLCAVLSVFLWFNRATGNIPVMGAEFEVVKGDTAYSISHRLYNDSYITSRQLFIFIVRVLRLDKNLKTGWIEIASDSSLVDVINAIYGGRFVTVTFTIPEGLTLKQIADILVENGIASKENVALFLSKADYTSAIGLDGFKSAEGFLYPDTYKFFKGVGIEKIFSSMVKLFFTKVEEIYPDYKNLTQKELYNKVVLASIIEREVRVKDEAPIVASVFNNRINIGMKLQSCATVQYILDKPKEQLLEDDLFIQHPYNTYLYRGLPPGPISSPGYNSLKAAFYPANTKYLYFVVKNPEEGSHHFSTTYEEHLEAQKKYKEIKGFK